jgi:hypothetical protein
MSSRALKFHPDARLDVIEAYEWYAQRSQMIGSKAAGSPQHQSQIKIPATGLSRFLAGIMCGDQASLGLEMALVGILALFCIAIGHGFLNADTARFGAIASLATSFVGGIVWFVYWTERKPRSFPAPNIRTSKLLVAITPLLFWVPVLGMVVSTAAVHRAYWLILPDWISSLLAVCFFVAALITFCVCVTCLAVP